MATENNEISPPRFHPITHVIFDMDGLLLNTEEFYSIAIQKTLDPYDCKFSWEMKHRTMGRKWLESIELMINHYKLPIGVDQFASICQEYLEALFPDAELLPGVEKLIRHLHKHDIPMCICTGSSKMSFDIKTSKHKHLFSLFRHIVCSPDEPLVKRGKPAPDVFLLGVSRFDERAKIGDVLVFEDAFNGVQAALNAGAQVVMVPDFRMDEEFRRQATLCLNSLEDFRPEWFGLPAF